MNFATVTFFLYLPTVFALYWVVRRRTSQNAILVIASYLFYCWWDYRFCLLMLGSSLLDFGIGWLLGTTDKSSRRRLLLAASIFANLGLLGVFKYYNFFVGNFQQLMANIGWKVSDVTLEIILPVGISFYTFQTLSYTIDVFREKLKPTRNLLDYLAFVSFFPQLVAGPIERATRLLPQFETKRVFDQAAARDGCRLILWGLFKKLVVADRLAVFVNDYYSDPDASGSFLALATVFFAFQIYCDFSAYSDIAIGSARLFNIRLMRNFNYPYFSRNLTEFWHRWHISLSTWFRDYVYIPLGGNRAGTFRRCINVMITFLVSGFWHGAAWRFLFWGGIHGAAVSAHSLKGKTAASEIPSDKTRIYRFSEMPLTLLKILCTFALVCFAWVFFRADSVPAALLIHQKIAYACWNLDLFSPAWGEIMANRELRRTVGILLAFVVVEIVGRAKECPLHMPQRPVSFRWATYSALILVTLEFVPRTGGQDFIYFDF